MLPHGGDPLDRARRATRLYASSDHYGAPLSRCASAALRRSGALGAVSPVDPLRRRQARIAWILVILCALFILGLGGAEFGAAQTSRYLLPTLRWLFPDLTISTYLELIVWIRKTAHVVEYAVLGALAFRAVFLSTDSALLRVALLAVGVAACVAATDELRQALLPARTGSAWDVALDVTGALVAIAFAFWLKRRAEQGVRRVETA